MLIMPITMLDSCTNVQTSDGGGQGYEDSVVGLVGMPRILAIQGEFSFGTILFDRVKCGWNILPGIFIMSLLMTYKLASNTNEQFTSHEFPTSTLVTRHVGP